MATIVTRAGKGSTLTFTEVDDNFTNLNTDLVAAEADIVTAQADIVTAQATADAAIPEAIMDAKGDLIVGSAADTAIKLTVGTDGKVLTAKASEPSGLSWETPAATAAAITFTPAGGIAANDVQEAIEELDTEKAPLASPALTGTPTAPTAAPLTSTTQIATTEYVDDAVAAIPAETVATDTIWANKGDLVAATGNDAAIVVPVGTDGYVLTADSGETAGVSWQEPGTTSAPTVQTFTSGSGTYTKPAGCTRIHVRLVGGGGGGSGGGTASLGTGGAGGTTTFGTSLLTATGGAGGIGGAGPVAGGTGTINSPAIGVATTGGSPDGSSFEADVGYGLSGRGGDSALWGGGGGHAYADTVGVTAVANTGGGGGGGSSSNQTNRYGGAGGAAGGSVDAIISAPTDTYAYAVGAAGTAGTAGTNGHAGGAGAAGRIVVTEYYGNFDSVLQLNEPASTKQVFTSGSGTYTTPAGVNRILVTAVGGGGGGSGGGSASLGTGGNGSNTTFGSSLLTASGASGASPPGNYSTSGATGTVSAPAVGTAYNGYTGSYGGNSLAGGTGGGSAFFGGGGQSAPGAAGISGSANTGQGGGGGGASSGNGGNGAGGGGTVQAWIWNPSSTYAYTVGGGGSAGAAGTNGFIGGAGGSGIIIVEEFYGPTNTIADVTPVGGYNRNKLDNGDFMIAQRGTSFTSATTFVNNDAAILLDRWRILSDGNDVVDVTQATDVPTAPGARYSIGLDVETVNKKFGIIQVIERNNCSDLIGRAAKLQFKARVTSTTKLDNVKAAVLYWTGTADSPTADVVSAWNVEGTDPTLVASYAYASSPTNLGVTTSFQRFTIDANIPNTATNVAVFIWSDVTDTTLGDFLYITDVQLEPGSVATNYERRTFQVEEDRCLRFLPAFRSDNTAQALAFGTTASTTTAHYTIPFAVKARVLPTGLTVSNVTHFQTTNAGFAANVTATNLTFLSYATRWCGPVSVTVASGLVADNATMLSFNSASGLLVFTGAEL